MPAYAPAGSAAPLPTAAQREAGLRLFLDVALNGAPLSRVAEFRRRADGVVLARRAELAALGIDAGEGDPEELIDLAALGIGCRIDDVGQRAFLTTAADRLRPAVYDAQARAGPKPPPVQTGFGSVLNYTLFASTNAELWNWFVIGDHKPAVSGAAEARVFGRLGVLTQSVVANSDLAGSAEALRLDTTWSHSDPETLRSWHAGDIVSGGLWWTRPIRMGGVQLQRNFGLQPDLVTLPVPEFSGSAAVPSTLEVYANNVRVFNKTVPAGPFTVSNIPAVTGATTAQVVVNDSLGRQTVTELPFYATARQLRKGLYDFSVEAGAPRRSYGLLSNDYAEEIAASGSLRYGLSDRLTLEGHAEAGRDLITLGGGAVFPLGGFGVMSLVAAASRAGDETGALFAASVEGQVRGVTLHARTRRSLGDYTDLALASAHEFRYGEGFHFDRARPAKSLDQAVVSTALPFDPARLSISFAQLEDVNGDIFRTLGATVSRPLGERASLYATGFTELGGEENYGLFAGVTFSLGNRITGTVSAAGDSSGGIAGGVDLARAEEAHAGSYGWRLRDREGETADRLAAGSYRARFGRLQGTVQQYGDAVRATAELDGALALTAGSLFVAPRIHDAFAVVDAGAPGVEVYRENRFAGVTGDNGKLLLPGLNSWEANTVAIDPKNLPVDVTIGRTRAVVVPADRNGVTVGFGIDGTRRNIRVTFRDGSGRFLPAGSLGRLDGAEEDFIIGYDGQAFLDMPGERAAAHVRLADGARCSAEIAAPPRTPDAVLAVGATCR